MKSIFGPSWRTTVGGLLAAAGAIAGIFDPHVGAAISAVGAAVIGMNARDSSVTSEQAGAK